MKYLVHYTVLKENEEIYMGEIELMLDSVHDALDVLKEQPLTELTEGLVSEEEGDISFEINYAIG